MHMLYKYKTKFIADNDYINLDAYIVKKIKEDPEAAKKLEEEEMCLKQLS